jgi:hypothetical protein
MRGWPSCWRSVAVWLTGLLLCACDAVPSAGDAAQDPTAPRAADFRSAAVDEALQTADQVIRTRGFEPEGDPWRGFLVRQAAQVIPIALHASTCYLWAGTGSRALELDLRVYDSEGREVADDGISGRGAALRFCPSMPGTFYLAARSANGSGIFGVRRYVGPTGLDVRLDDLFSAVTPPLAAEAEP